MQSCPTLALGLRPHHALVLLGDRRQSFIEELLDSLPTIGLGCKDVALRIGGDAMHRVELTRLPAAVTEGSENFERIALQDVDLHIRPVGDIKILLLRILRERDIEYR